MGSFVGERRKPGRFASQPALSRRELLALGAIAAFAGVSRLARAVEPEGQLTWGIHVSLAPTWFDPADTQGIITPFMVLYALHDAMVKPMPGQPMSPSLAESWSASEDGRSLSGPRTKGPVPPLSSSLPRGRTSPKVTAIGGVSL